MEEERRGDERGEVTETLDVVQNQNTKSWKRSKSRRRFGTEMSRAAEKKVPVRILTRCV